MGMQGLGSKWFLGGILVLSMVLPLQGHAAEWGSREPASQTGGRRSGGGDASMAVTTASDPSRKQIYRDLLSAETPQLSWPAFPRIWMERSKAEYMNSQSSLGLQIPIIEAGTKLQMNLRYGLKTTLVIMSSMRKFNGVAGAVPVASSKNSVVRADKDTESTILRWDESTKLVYPDVKDEYPMVGFCSYEASLSNDTFKRFGIEIAGSGQAFESGTVEVGAQTLFSNFFQVRGDLSVRAYLEDVCGRVFRESIEKSVIADFSKVVMEKIVHDNPNSRCEPPAGNARDALSAQTGDLSCLEWHATQPDPIRKLTIPRCQMGVDGAYRCVNRARGNTACTLYRDVKTKKNTEYFVGRKVVRLTSGDYEYPCDGSLGLKCEMVEEPWMLWGQPFWSGKARCKAAY